ncbi:MAG: flagellar biosynthesis protein FlhB [Oligoflexales bacterium]
MAEENEDGQEKTEDPTDERRQEFRNRGEIAYSREITSTLVLVSAVAFLSFFAIQGFNKLARMFTIQFELITNLRISPENFPSYFTSIWMNFLEVVIPITAVSLIAAATVTFAQTRISISFQKLKPNFGRMNPLAGLKRMVSGQALLELGKSIGKMLAVGVISYLILYGERAKIPGLMKVPLGSTWEYWGSISKLMFWSVSIFLFLIATVDYIYTYFTLENKMKMTKQEVKDEYKQRELNPQIKGKMRRLQREFSLGKTIEATKEATVIITNPTHYAVALKYEIGMDAPLVLAKGVDFIALNMRELAKKYDIPLVENRPLARALYKTAEVDSEIPHSLYKAVSEVIRYVFRLKGIKVKQDRKQ